MDMNIDKVRNILIDLDNISDKLSNIPQSYVTLHIENKLEIVSDLIIDLEEYFESRLSELENKITDNDKLN